MEILLFCLVLVGVSAVVMAAMIILYGKNRPTKLFMPILPGIVVSFIAFYILGIYSTSWIAAIVVFIVLSAAISFNFIYVNNKLTRPLSRIAYGVGEGGKRVFEASQKVALASDSLAQGATAQSAGVEQSSASLEEIASMIKVSSDNAQQGLAMNKETLNAVRNVDQHIGQMIEAMNEINASSEQTGKIIKTIDEIAFQTNLLALNAAVEAARAGDAGAGFAVVANEVRNLAMRAAQAAHDTGTLINNTINVVRHGREITLKTKEAFKQNVEFTEKMGSLIEEIAEASREEDEGISQLNKVVAEIDHITQKTAGSAEELASEAGNSTVQAEKMKAHIADFISLVGVGAKGTLKDCKALVKRGRTLMETAGKDKALEALGDPNGAFVDLDLYISVYSMEGYTVQHPYNKALIGYSAAEAKDTQGKFYVKEMLDIAGKKGSGYVAYTFLNPISQKEELKTAYFEKVGNFVLAAGAYK